MTTTDTESRFSAWCSQHQMHPTNCWDLHNPQHHPREPQTSSFAATVKGRFSISKTFEFSAHHKLFGLPEGHQCARDHGHNYVVTIKLSGALDGTGFVRDYGELREVKSFIDAYLDHRSLNDLPQTFKFAPENPTAEQIARWLYIVFKEKFPELCGVGVSETPKTQAWYDE